MNIFSLDLTNSFLSAISQFHKVILDGKKPLFFSSGDEIVVEWVFSPHYESKNEYLRFMIKAMSLPAFQENYTK